MNSANLSDELQIEAEDDYRIYARRGSMQEAKPKKKRRKESGNDESSHLLDSNICSAH
jgi:hypothetical protein